jgi:hypothetical protein
LEPGRWDFQLMYNQLCRWHERHRSTVVPRFVHDAPMLGAWTK